MTFVYLTVLILAFFLLVIAEFLVPSGGILGATAVAALVAAIVVAFYKSIALGVAVIVFVLFTTPLLLVGMVRAWPHTPLGRRMLNRRPGDVAQSPPRKTTAHGVPLDELVGRIGIAQTNLLPSGLVVIDGEKVDAVSSGMPIDSGTKVVVTHIEVGRLHVREATEADGAKPVEAKPQSPPSLEGPLESLDVE